MGPGPEKSFPCAPGAEARSVTPLVLVSHGFPTTQKLGHSEPGTHLNGRKKCRAPAHIFPRKSRGSQGMLYNWFVIGKSAHFTVKNWIIFWNSNHSTVPL